MGATSASRTLCVRKSSLGGKRTAGDRVTQVLGCAKVRREEEERNFSKPFTRGESGWSEKGTLGEVDSYLRGRGVEGVVYTGQMESFSRGGSGGQD